MCVHFLQFAFYSAFSLSLWCSICLLTNVELMSVFIMLVRAPLSWNWRCYLFLLDVRMHYGCTKNFLSILGYNIFNYLWRPCAMDKGRRYDIESCMNCTVFAID